MSKKSWRKCVVCGKRLDAWDTSCRCKPRSDRAPEPDDVDDEEQSFSEKLEYAEELREFD